MQEKILIKEMGLISLELHKENNKSLYERP